MTDFIVDPIVDFATSFIDAVRLLGVFLLMLLEKNRLIHLNPKHLAVAGCIPWLLALGILGRSVGDNWEQWRDKLHYLDYPIALALLAGAVWLFIRWCRSRGPEPAERPA